MRRRPPRSTRTDTLFPYTTLFRSALVQRISRGVERLAEFHDVDAALTERRPERRRRVGGAGGHLQLDIAADLLGHDGLLSFCRPGRNPGLKISGPAEGITPPPARNRTRV